jgi:hypothetical protein
LIITSYHFVLSNPFVYDSLSIVASEVYRTGDETIYDYYQLSYGYNSLIQIGSIFFPGIPVSTIASVFRIIMVFSLFYGFRIVLEFLKIKPFYSNFFSLFFLVLVSVTSFGTIGLWSQGKESVLGISLSASFLSACVIIVFTNNSRIKLYAMTMLHVITFVAISLGLVSAPYLLPLYVLILLIYWNSSRVNLVIPLLVLLQFLLSVFFGKFLTFKLESFIFSFLSVGLLLSLVFLNRNSKSFFILQFKYLHFLRNFYNKFYIIFFVVLLFLLNKLLPFKVLINSPDGVSTTRYPTDGITTFFGLIAYLPDTNTRLVFYLFLLSVFISILIKIFNLEGDKNFFKLILSFFLATSFPAILGARILPDALFSTLGKWDLVKDLPQWFFPLFTIYMLTLVIGYVISRHNSTFIFCTFLLTSVLIVSIPESRAPFYRTELWNNARETIKTSDFPWSLINVYFRNDVFYSNSIGSKDMRINQILNRVYYRNNTGRYILLDNSDPFLRDHIWIISMYGFRVNYIDSSVKLDSYHYNLNPVIINSCNLTAEQFNYYIPFLPQSFTCVYLNRDSG